jgi:hypothetical protein
MTADLNQIYEALLRIERGQGALDSKVEALGDRFDSHVIDDKKVADDVAGLKHREAYRDGKTAGISAAVAVVVAIGSKWLGLHS